MVSIIIPVREENADLLVYKLEKLEEGSFCDFEVIIVDDCSPRHMENLGKFKFPYSILRLDDPTPYNMTVARNRGADIARGEWIGFTDVDISFSSDDMKSLLERTISNGSEVGIGCVKLPHGIHPGWKDGLTWFGVMTKSIFLRAGKFDEGFRGHYGWDDILLHRALSKLTNFTYVDSIFAYCRRLDKGSAGGVDIETNRRKFLEIMRKG